MTREEAIDRLRKISEKTPIRTNGDDLLAITMAIQALSQEPCEDATLKDIFCMGCEYREQEPCDDAISREAVITIAGTHTLTIDETVKALERLPSVTQKSGKWLTDEIIHNGCKYTVTYCSECEEQADYRTPFCPNCGARMESEE